MSSGRGAIGGRGRGAYYKARYGRGGRGTRPDNASPGAASINSQHGDHSTSPSAPSPQGDRNWASLQARVQNLDKQSYGAYKSLLGEHVHEESPRFTLKVDFVQSDPYAAPSRVRVSIDPDVTKLPSRLFETETRRVALADYLTRAAADFIRSKRLDQDVSSVGGWSAPKGGAFNINAPGQEVLKRTSCIVGATTQVVELRFTVKLPAQGRTILGREAAKILVDALPKLVRECLIYSTLDQDALSRHVECIEQQHTLRDQLKSQGLVAFIANGAVLPRKSGFQSLPLTGSEVIPFKSPSAFEVKLKGLNGQAITGMGIKSGVTVLTGGGFHGKSTVLEAIQYGVYDTIPGDGRENVVTDSTAYKIRAEDGRSVTGTDISPFINGLPGRSTSSFTSADASGSTSMAANIQEALELGSKLLLIDEDSSATNLLVRDARMQELISAEPITPFCSKVRALYRDHNVSTIIVIGGCGDYLSVVDSVIGMDSYLPVDLTAAAKNIVKKYPAAVQEHTSYGRIPNRSISVPSAAFHSGPPVARSLSFIELKDKDRHTVIDPAAGRSGVDLSGIEQLVEQGQVRFIAETLLHVSSRPDNFTMDQLMDNLEKLISKDGLDATHGQHWVVGDTVAVRRLELGAAINRLRCLQVDAEG